jgi:hypothetical protein
MRRHIKKEKLFDGLLNQGGIIAGMPVDKKLYETLGLASVDLRLATSAK